MDTADGMKRYCSTEEIESLLQERYGDRIQPVDPVKLQQLRMQQQRSASWNSHLRAM